MESKPPPNDFRDARKKFFIAYLLGALTIVAVLAAVEFAGLLCSGPCAVRQCTPANPCVWNGKRYVTGKICGLGEGLVCDVGYVFDCHCKTLLETLPGGAKQPTCVCQ